MEYCVDYLKKARKHLDDAVDIFNTIENDLNRSLPKELQDAWRDASLAYSRVNNYLEEMNQ